MHSDQQTQATFIRQLQEAIEPLRKIIIAHPVYGAIQTPADLHLFMEHHVYAVWDFMSLLKGLQNKLTCTTIPWQPVGSANTRFLINEIVVGEESDVDQYGNRTSHFELYLNAMQQAGANTNAIGQLMRSLQSGEPLSTAIQQPFIPAAASRFMAFTFDVINSGEAHLMASVFTFGREDLIPNMFHAMVKELQAAMPGKLNTYQYYLDRHIEVDGDHHSHLALEMTAELCGHDPAKWAAATTYSIAALQCRIELWDAVFAQIKSKTAREKVLEFA